jgi:site-specific recombinase XerD
MVRRCGPPSAPCASASTSRTCLRHSYVTHLIEAGYDPLFVQQQVGHEYASTLALYTSVSSDYKTTMVRRALEGEIARALGRRPGGGS